MLDKEKLLSHNSMVHETINCFTKKIALQRTLFQYQNVDIIRVLFIANICYGYSLEASHWDASNEYPQHMLS